MLVFYVNHMPANYSHEISSLIFPPKMKKDTTKFGICCSHMGESFQDYSLIQDFKADFPEKVSLKMLNSADYYRFSDL